MDREAYRQRIRDMWQVARLLDRHALLHLEIAAKRCGTAEEYHAVRVLRRAAEDMPDFPPHPKVEG